MATFSLSGRSAFESWLRAAARLSTVPGAPPTPPWRVGTTLCHGRFVLRNVLGRGGMGIVYEAFDQTRGAAVALKTLLDIHPERLLDFKQEFRALADVHHPNLVQLDELFEDDGRWFFTMEKVAGVPFSTYVRSSDAWEGRLRACLVQLARGLNVLHGMGKVHRDVKPSNTLVTADGRLVLLDFGLLIAVHERADARRLRAGTAAYMAPEQADGEAGPAADWYAVGVMLYEALTGALPFDGDSTSVLAQKRERDPLPLSSYGARAPADLEALCLELLQRDPRRRPQASEILQRLEPPGNAAVRELAEVGEDWETPTRVFVGRRDELAAIEEAFRRAGQGGPKALLVRGASGVGKSALLAQFAQALGSRAKIFAGRCYEHEFVPFKAIDGIMDDLARYLDRLDAKDRARVVPAGLPALARIFPVFADANAPCEAEAPSDPRDARQRAFEALKELLARLAEETPVVLVVDDVQWADEDSLALIADVLSSSNTLPLFWLLAARTEVELPALAQHARTLVLSPLARADATELARRLLEGRPEASDHDPAWFADQAGGHPLFIETLVRRTSAERRSNDATLHGAMSSRIAALEPDARALVELSSCAAQPLSVPLLAHAAGLAPEPCSRLLRGLKADHLLRSRQASELVIEPYHDCVRSAAVACMGPERLSACHRHIAETLEALAPERSEALAVHWHAAGAQARAREHALIAAHRARKALAFDRAASLYGFAVDLFAPGAAPAEVHRWHADALANAGRGREAAAAYQAAARLSAREERLELEQCAADQLLRSGHIEEGLAAMDALLQGLGMSRPRTTAGAVALLVRDEARRAIAALGRPVRSRRAPPPALARRADACWVIAMGLAQVDPIAGAVFQARYLDLAARLGDPRRLALSLCLTAGREATLGPPAHRARELLDRVEHIATELGDVSLMAYHVLTEANVAFLVGDYPGAIRHGERAIALLREHCTGVAKEIATAQRVVLESLWHTGRLRELSERASDVYREASARGDRYAATQLQTTVLPIVHLTNDDPAAAAADLQSALAAWPEKPMSLQHWQHRQLSAVVELYAGRPEAAMALLEAPNLRLDWVMLTRIAAVRVFSSFVRGSALLGVAARDPARRSTLLRRARRHVARLERDGATAAAALLRGQVELLQARRSDAAAQFQLAAELFEQRGMQLLSAVASLAHGLAIGGAASHAQERLAWMASQRIRNPAGFFRLLAPGAALAGLEGGDYSTGQLMSCA